MNRIYKIIVLLILFLFYYLIFVCNVRVPCLFKFMFHISCPMCGITRSIKALLDGDILLSLHYNLLGIVIFIFIIFNFIVFLYDIIFNKDKVKFLYDKVGNYYILIIISLVINMIINNIKEL